MCKDSNDIKDGQIVTFRTGIDPDKCYRVLYQEGNGMVRCEDTKGNRFSFSKKNLLHATENEKLVFYNLK